MVLTNTSTNGHPKNPITTLNTGESTCTCVKTTFSHSNRVSGLPMNVKEAKNSREIKRGGGWEQKRAGRGETEKNNACSLFSRLGARSENGIAQHQPYNHAPRRLRSGGRENCVDGIPSQRKCRETQLGEHQFHPWGKRGQECPPSCNHVKKRADMYLF